MHEVLLLKSILIQKKILWKINFVLIKFSLNALLFEKLWNEYKNPSFLHKAIRIESDHGSMKIRRCLSAFVALYSRRLWMWPCSTDFPTTPAALSVPPAKFALNILPSTQNVSQNLRRFFKTHSHFLKNFSHFLQNLIKILPLFQKCLNIYIFVQSFKCKFL